MISKAGGPRGCSDGWMVPRFVFCYCSSGNLPEANEGLWEMLLASACSQGFGSSTKEELGELGTTWNLRNRVEL